MKATIYLSDWGFDLPDNLRIEVFHLLKALLKYILPDYAIIPYIYPHM